MSPRKSKKILLTSIFIGFVFLWWLRRVSNSVPGEKFAREFLFHKVGNDRAHQLLSQFRENYRDLYQQREIPKNRVLRIHLNHAILPVVAFYQVLLLINDGDKGKTIQEIETVIREWILSSTRYFISPLQYLPHPFKIFRPGFAIVMKLFPPAGFDIDYLEKSDILVAFNIKDCYYLNILNRYDLPELTPVFCGADEAMAELFPPSIGFERTQTLGKGGEMCDFRYCHKNVKKSESIIMKKHSRFDCSFTSAFSSCL